MLARRRSINKFLFYAIIWWVVINSISYGVNKTYFDWNLFIGYIIWMLIPYFGIKLIGKNFWFSFDNWIYFLTLISTTLFFINILTPNTFKALSPTFESLTNDLFRKKATQETYWYGFFYTHSGREDFRNYGFMWESGAFAMILTVMIVFRWSNYGIKLERRCAVYFIALLTTFSTAGYLGLLVFMLVYVLNLLKNGKPRKGILLGLFFLVLGIYIWNSDFMRPKIASFISDSREEVVYHQGYINRWEANRVYSFFLDWKQGLKLPSGYGIVPNSDQVKMAKVIVGVNGIGEIILMWGMPGLFLFIYLIFKFSKNGHAIFNNKILAILLATTLFIVFFSNPIIRNPLLFLVAFSGILSNELQKTDPLTDQF